MHYIKNKIFTIEHSTHTINDFINLLKKYNIQRLVDVRTIPGSRYNPQFNKETLSESLKNSSIEYFHMKGLGGLSNASQNSKNSGWKNMSFRGYADYMQTSEFEMCLTDLIVVAKKFTVVIMCAESVPWKCHRSLISDALTIRGMVVGHIMGYDNCKTHLLTPWAKVNGTEIIYPET